jgi:chemotaxis protein MotB
VFGAGLARWAGSATDAVSPSTIVLVDLPPAEAPATDTAARQEVREGGAVDPRDERRERLEAENAELAAGLADADRRTAQLEAAYRQQIDELKTAASHLGEEAAALAADNAALAAELAAGRARLAAVEDELAARREADDAAVAELRSAHERLVSALRREIADRDVALEQASRRLTVSIVDRVLFPSGQATLTPEGEPVIDRIATVLAGLPHAHILVEGHTDNVPISPALQARFPSNWELSTARAAEVVRRLILKAGIPPERLRVAGRADTEPVAANDTEDGRRRNRRIEIILLPDGATGAADLAS